MSDHNEFFKNWLNPGVELRSAPFWSWNGKLEEEELRQQIRTFKQMGMGGFFMHSRIGLGTPYLSQEWFALINACIDEAKEQNMQAWLYDEDRWPSGYAGGLVTQNPDYRMQLIYLSEVPFAECKNFSAEGEIVALFAAAAVSEDQVAGLRKVASCSEVQPGETLLIFTLRHAPLTNWYNGFCYLNPMNPDAVQRFLEVTHQAYQQHCGSEFGKTLPGIFTDEPQYGFVVSQLVWAGETAYSTPYDPQIRALIQQRYGYDLYEHLAELFYNVQELDFPIVRLHYLTVMTELFIENYACPIGEWCQQHKLNYTGHVMGEDSLARLAWNCGSAMRFYQHMGMPGIDVLSERESNYFIARMLSSAARQFGQKDRLAELYGCTGWDFPPAGHKAVGDWLLAQGVNFRCQHLADYTLAGEAKRDYPASISYQLNWHTEHQRLENYFARLNAALRDAREEGEILLLLPVESAWCFIRKGFLEAEDTLAFDQHFAELQKELLRSQLEYDLGDEALLASIGRVMESRMQVGLISYRAIVVPKMITIRESTLQLLEAFHAAGGQLIFVDAAAARVDGHPDSRPAELAARCASAKLSDLSIFQRVHLSAGEGEILCHRRSEASRHWLFVVNAGCVPGREESRIPWAVPPVLERQLAFPELEITWQTENCGRYLYEANPETGNFSSPEAQAIPGGWKIKTSLAPLASRLFLESSEPLPNVSPIPAVAEMPEWVQLPREFQYHPDRPNILVLDHFQGCLTGKAMSWDATYVLTLDEQIRKGLGIPLRSPDMKQPWMGLPPAGESAELELNGEFHCLEIPQGELWLALENPERFRVRVNQQEISNTPVGWLLDRSCKTLVVPAHCLKTGRNNICISTCYDYTHPGLETMFLVGTFGVQLTGTTATLQRLPEVLHQGSWVDQGFPFFPGSLTYQARIQRKTDQPYWLKLNFTGSFCRVSLKGKQLKVLMWPPYEIDLSEWIAPGEEALLELEIAGSPRNMFGPFFAEEASPHLCLPTHFKEYSGGARRLIEYGL